MIVVLPAPVAPTRATVRPGSTVKETSRRTGVLGRVREPDVLEARSRPRHRARTGRRPSRVARSAGRVSSSAEDALGGGHRGLQDVELLREVGDRAPEALRVLDEGHEHAERQAAGRGRGRRRRPGSERRSRGPRAARSPGRRPRSRRSPHVRVGVPAVDLGEGASRLFASRPKSCTTAMPERCSCRKALIRATQRRDLAERVPRALAEPVRDGEEERDDGEGDEGEAPVEHEHHAP